MICKSFEQLNMERMEQDSLNIQDHSKLLGDISKLLYGG